MPDHSDMKAIEESLDAMPDAIEHAANEMNEALDIFNKAKTDLALECARIMHLEKANSIAAADAQLSSILLAPRAEAQVRLKLLKMKHPTVEDLNAVATQQTYKMAQELNVKEAAYHAKETTYWHLRHEFDVLKEKSWNNRAVMKTTGG